MFVVGKIKELSKVVLTKCPINYFLGLSLTTIDILNVEKMRKSPHKKMKFPINDFLKSDSRLLEVR